MMRPALPKLIIAILCLFIGYKVNSQTIFVNGAATGANDGSSWANAYTNLRVALAAATSGTQVWVAAGTYKPASNNNRDSAFVLKNGVKLYGGFAGTETVLTARNSATNITTLSGDITGDNSYHVLMAIHCDTSTLIDGVTIQDGQAGSSDSLIVNGVMTYKNQGGALYIHAGAPVVVDCIFSNNYTMMGTGGAVYTENDATSFKTCTFNNNSATDGGACHTKKSYCQFDSCTFSNNTAATSQYRGGAIFSQGGSTSISNSLFTGNMATYGGAICNTNDTCYIYGCQFIKNYAFQNTNAYAYGGAVCNVGSFSHISNSIFRQNKAWAANNPGYGGAVYDSLSCIKLINSIVDSNIATTGNGTTHGQGGAMYNRYDTATIYNCLFVDNIATYSNDSSSNYTIAGVYGLGDILYMSNCTFFKHGTSVIHITSSGFFNTIIQNTIVWKGNINSACIRYNCLLQGALEDVPFGIYNKYPLFNDTTNNDFTLQRCSPAVNMGDTTKYLGNRLIDTDLAGNIRVQQGKIDIGAFESAYPAVNITSLLADTIICAGDSRVFYVTAAGDSLKYRWEIARNGIDDYVDWAQSDTLQLANVDNSMNNWKIRAIVNTCSEIAADTAPEFSLHVNPLPQPTVTWLDNVLVTGKYASYQWFLDSVAIPASNTDTFAYTTYGRYYVYVTDTNGCSAYSPTVWVIETGVGNNKYHIAKVYPNPATTLLHVQAPIPVSICITNLQGTTILQASGAKRVDISSLAPGIYLYYISNADRLVVGTGKLTKLE